MKNLIALSLSLLALVFISPLSAQTDGTWAFDNQASQSASNPIDPDNSFWLKIDGNNFILANSNDRGISRNASHWTYFEGRIKNQKEGLLLKIKRRFAFSTNTGSIIGDTKGQAIKKHKRTIRLSVTTDTHGNLTLVPSGYFPFGTEDIYLLNTKEEPLYYPVQKLGK